MDRKSPSNCLVSPRESFTNIPHSRLTLLPPRLQQAPYLPITALLLSARPPLMALRLSAGLSLCARLPIPLLSVPHVAGSVFCFHFFFFFFLSPPSLSLNLHPCSHDLLSAASRGPLRSCVTRDRQARLCGVTLICRG